MDSKHALPFAPPSFVTATRIAALAAFFGGAALGLEAVLRIGLVGELMKTTTDGLAVALCTGALSALLVAVASRGQTVGAATALCGLGVPLGVVNAVLCLLAVLTVNEGFEPSAFPAVIGLGALYGGFFGGPLGLGMGALFALPVRAAARARVTPSHDGIDRVLVAVGLWALAIGGFALGLAIERVESPLPRSALTDFFPLATLGLGAAALAAGLLRRALRNRWLRAVAAGSVAGFRLVPMGSLATHGMLPVHRNAANACDSILVRSAEVSGLPYRSGVAVTPCALASSLPR